MVMITLAFGLAALLLDAHEDARSASGVFANRVCASTSSVSSSATLSADRRFFQARFDSSDWSGQLLAFGIGPGGLVDSRSDWNAAEVLATQNYDTGREVITFKPVARGGAGQGIAFRWPASYTSPDVLTDFSAAQIDTLLQYAPFPSTTVDTLQIAANQSYGAALINYLRGRRSNTLQGFAFRARASVLGAIVNSAPRYVGAPDFRYPESVAPKSYAAFKLAHMARKAMLYVGANDGMLHGFAGSDGREAIAYIPSAVIKNIASLSRPDYAHRYFVDSVPTIVDAYLATMIDPASALPGAWRSVLAAGLGGGGQAVFALDVTNPAAFAEANAAGLVLWEFDDSDDADLGYTYGKPQIAKMANGRWAAVFGNGYNNTESDGNASATGHAVLYVVDLETGHLLRKLDTQAGAPQAANGLATPTLLDHNADFIVDIIYAGDLLGNMWKFDVSDIDPAQWGSSYSSDAHPQPLFTAQAGQAITSQAQLTSHPDGLDGFMVYFGTGKYLGIDDNSSRAQSTQSFYGIWDKNLSSLTAFDSGDLITQTINKQYGLVFDGASEGAEDASHVLRELSDNEVDFTYAMGWKLDLRALVVEGVANTNNFAERQITNAFVRDGRVIFTTLTSTQQACEAGSSGFVMQLNYRNGGALGFAGFDLNGDGVFDAADTNAAGRMSAIGVMPTLNILAGSDSDIVFVNGGGGAVDTMRLNAGQSASGRQSWRELD